MSKVKIVERIGEVMREVHFDSFEDFMEYERVNNSRVEEKLVLKTSPEDGDWRDNNGLEVCPVDGRLTVEVELRDGFKFQGIASGFYWHQSDEPTDIIKYRIVEEEK